LRPQRDTEQLAKAAELYFLEERSQDDIAAVLSTTRSNVSRMLKQARELGIVRIRIEHPSRRDEQLEQALCDRLGLVDARVLAIEPGADPLPGVGRLAARWLTDRLRDGDVLALGWGATLQATADAMQAMDGAPQRDVQVVQLIGGLSTIASGVTGQELARRFAERLGGSYRYLHAPAVFASARRLQTMLDEPAIRDALAAARSADIALVGLGDPHHGSVAAWIPDWDLSPAERRRFTAGTAVGDICGRFYDLSGSPVITPVSDRLLAVSLDELRRIPTFVAAAAGRAKGASILGAVRGRLVDVLICDEHAARAVLELDHQPSA
jgi:DNA-binding transcriptional regulator LsrR (DeoR family)